MVAVIVQQGGQTGRKAIQKLSGARGIILGNRHHGQLGACGGRQSVQKRESELASGAPNLEKRQHQRTLAQRISE